MSKKPIEMDLGSFIDTARAPIPTGIPQRGAEPHERLVPRPKPERRMDQVSVRCKPSIRAAFEAESRRLDIPQAELFEIIIRERFGLID
ncbi:hypothetical protein [Paracoccus litorisediminis]|uniref:Uncharacterized protein n=1 Tax=Paracoccus litorisediminis TaxID=2006130 RepID=A0A844HUI4_9RHOB|nr:hypothetical protein [Paracoccus litorisediminis]MTH62124.1 hypothetical protein [Paracoccus litorisediminis]